MSQEDLADAVDVATSTVARWERGEVTPRPKLRPLLAHALGLELADLADLLDPPHATTAPARADWSAVLAPSAPTPPSISEPLMTALMTYRPPAQEPLTERELADEVAAIRIDYQATRYSAVNGRLPALLVRLTATVGLTAGGRIGALTAAALMTAAGVALKCGDGVLAGIASDRAMLAAAASGDPAAMGASARTVVHTLMRAGQNAAATDLAVVQAAQLDSPDPHVRAVRGALLLRGAMAAAGGLDRDRAVALLDEADSIAVRLPPGHTGGGAMFTSVNVSLHRMHLALSLGDAGSALALARQIDVDTIPLVERKATLAIDVARAYTQWGRYESALSALHLAMQIAPEEVRTRRVVGELVDTLGRAGPPSLRPHVREYAARMTEAA